VPVRRQQHRGVRICRVVDPDPAVLLLILCLLAAHHACVVGVSGRHIRVVKLRHCPRSAFSSKHASKRTGLVPLRLQQFPHPLKRFRDSRPVLRRARPRHLPHQARDLLPARIARWYPCRIAAERAGARKIKVGFELGGALRCRLLDEAALILDVDLLAALYRYLRLRS
jgi:hypothetical protein